MIYLLRSIQFRALALFLVPSLSPLCAQTDPAEQCGKSLTFFASFDNSIDADFALGDKSLWNAPALNQRQHATVGLPASQEVVWNKGGGRWGGSLRFSKSTGPMVFYRAEKNFSMSEGNLAKAVSFWLNTDPEKDLPTGFCDPLQITSKQWDDAALFVEFEKRPTGTAFRLGAYADKQVWNPTNRKFEEIPAVERPLIGVNNPPFQATKWTHVAFTISNFNSHQNDGAVNLYLNGKKVGDTLTRKQTLTWDENQSAAMLGLNFVGQIDEIAFFDRALQAEEIEYLFRSPTGISGIAKHHR